MVGVMSEFRQQLCDYATIDKCENSAHAYYSSANTGRRKPSKGNAKMKTQQVAVTAVGIPTNLQPATLAAFTSMQVAVLGLAKASGKVSSAIRAAKVAAFTDPVYLTGSAMVNGKSQPMPNTGAIAADLVRILSDVHATAQAGAVKASAAKKFADSRDRAAFERSQMKPVLDAIQYAKNSVIDLVGGSQQSRITYDGKAKAYVITQAPDAGKAPTGGKAPDAGKGKAPDAGKGKAPDAGKGKAPDAGKGKAPDAGKGKSPDAGKGKSPTEQAQELATSTIDGAPGIMVAMLRDGILSRSLRVSFGENPDADRVAIIAAAMELEAAITALQPRKSK